MESEDRTKKFVNKNYFNSRGKRQQKISSESKEQEPTPEKFQKLSFTRRRRSNLESKLSKLQEEDHPKTMSSSRRNKKKNEKKKEPVEENESLLFSEDKTEENPVETEREQHSDSIRSLLSRLGSINSHFTPTPSLSRNRLNNLLEGIKSPDEGLILQSLMELCDYLSIGTEDNMSNFNVDGFVPALVNLLNYEHNPELMLMSCRALAYLMEALPSTCSNIVSAQAIPLLVARLLSIEYIDLAEQALQCLEKISYEHSLPILKAGGLMACITFLDFFQTGTQRIAITTAANACRRVPNDLYAHVEDAIPILTNLLQSHDSKVVEKTILCFSRLAESFLNDPKKLSKLADHNLIPILIRLISDTSSQEISVTTYTLVVKLLTFFSVGCPHLAQQLHESNIADVLHSTLTGKGKSDSSGSTVMSADQLHEILSLINETLPPLPKDVIWFLQYNIPQPFLNFRSLSSKSGKSTPSKSPKKKKKEMQETEKGSKEEISDQEEKDPRELILNANPKYLDNFGNSLLIILIQVFTSTVNSSPRYKCISAITKIVYFSSAESLKNLLRHLSFSSFIATLLNSSDQSVVATALKICEILMEKLPDIFSKYFRREGVVHEIQNLSSNQPKKSTPKSNKLENWIVEHAIKIKETFFNDKLDSGRSEQLIQLKTLSEKLEQLSKLKVVDAKDKEVLENIRDFLISDEGVSTFEFIGSDIVSSLLGYLTGNDKEEGKSMESQVQSSLLLERASLFCSIFLHPNKSEKSVHPLLILVRKLNHSLNKLEDFPVTLSDLSSTTSTLKYLTQPLKVKFKKSKQNPPYVRDYSKNTVQVEPFATFTAIEQFLKEKIKNNTKVEKNEQILEDSEFEEMEEDSDEELSHTKPSKQEIPQDKDSKFIFTINGEHISHSTTIFKALLSDFQKEAQHSQGQINLIQQLWEKTHTITYHLVNSEELADKSPQKETFSQVLDHPYLNFLKTSLLPISTNTNSILYLLRVLHELNGEWVHFQSEFPGTSQRHVISPVEFVNNKITSKILRQLQDPLCLCSGALPNWCTLIATQYSFLLAFECRKLYCTCTSFGIARALQNIQQNVQGSNSQRNNETRIGRIQRQKVRISRAQILESAKKVMELYGNSKAVLEVEYFNEVGTGLGPTLEFFTLVSRELQKKRVQMWRDEKPNDESELVYSLGGLFPKPVQQNKIESELLDLFRFMGILIAKALLDSRLLDLHLSVPFLKKMLGQDLTILDLKYIDSEFGSSLEKMAKICNQKRKIEIDESMAPDEKKQKIEALKLGNSGIDELDLDFTLPGHPQWELKPDGRNCDVTIYNLEEYVNLVTRQHLVDGVAAQFAAFEEGFNKVFPLRNLSIFTVEELETLICGSAESEWDMQDLLENTRCDHGFTHNSQTVQYLFEVMTEMTTSERQKFLLFVTGSPRLPPGGFKSLDPKLTIVRKEQDSKDSPDEYLPSVNCCFYYLKLPEYSSKQVLREKLMFAIENGQGHFSFN